MSVGSRLKERREAVGITQEELAKLLGVSKGAIGNYETGISYPKIENMTKLFDLLKTDANYIFQDDLTVEENHFSEEEKRIVSKIRSLDKYGKKSVIDLLENEYDRCQSQKE